MDSVGPDLARRGRRARAGVLGAVALLGAAFASAQSARERDAELQAVRKEIKALEARVAGHAELAELDARTQRAAAELASLEASEAAQLASLERARDEWRALVAKLDSSVARSNAAIAKARADEKRLADLVAELTQLMAGFPLDGEQPFAGLKGKLAWPVQGRLAGEFGQPREGGPVKWTGVLLETSQGTPVRAIYRGRV